MTDEEKAADAGNVGGLGDAVEADASTPINIIRPDTEEHPAGSLSAALKYATRGLAVFPLSPGASVPYAGSHGHLDATTDAELLRRTWPAPDANVGVRTGAGSGVWVLDSDPRHGGDASLRRLLDENGREGWDTVADLTPGGGIHLWWRWPEGVEIRNSAGAIAPGLDVRGEGGYVAAPPSRRPDGAYRWLPAPAGGVADAPAWLLELAVAASAKREGKFAEPVVGVIADGTRNVKLLSIAGKMRDFGCSERGIYAMLAAENAERCDPPVSDKELRGLVARVMGYPIGKAWWAAAEAEDVLVDEAAAKLWGLE